MTPLRIATFNLGLLEDYERAADKGNYTGTVIEYFIETENSALERANKICDRILDSPYDVICLNEVFSESARFKLILRLAPAYPFYVTKFGDTDLFTTVVEGVEEGNIKLEDSGLMVFSRYPFVPFEIKLPNSTFSFKLNHLFSRYDHATNFDRMARKGAAFVVIDSTTVDGQILDSRRIMISFSHLQADYSKSNSSTRKKQIEQWHKALKVALSFFSKDISAATLKWVIMCGDFNIIAEDEFGVQTTEYNDFMTTSPFGHKLIDLFRFTTPTKDRGLTQQAGQRLDYIFVGSATNILHEAPLPNPFPISYHTPKAINLLGGGNLVITHVRYQNHLARGGSTPYSDHYGLNAIIGQIQPACTPINAMKPVQGINPGTGEPYLSANINISQPGALQWVFIEKPGTYFFAGFEDEPHTRHIFLESDLSYPLSDLPPHGENPPRGERFLLTQSSYVRIGDYSGGTIAQTSLVITPATGATQSTAILLPGEQLVKGINYPKINNVLNPEDAMYLELPINEATKKTGQKIDIQVDWPVTPGVNNQLFECWAEDVDGNPLSLKIKGYPPLSITMEDVNHGSQTPSQLYLRVKRLNLTTPPFSAIWHSNLNIFHGLQWHGHNAIGGEPAGIPGSLVPLSDNFGELVFETFDETGPDWPGSDEAVIFVWADDQFVTSYKFEDMDSGDWEGIAPISFVHNLYFQMKESADVGDVTSPNVTLTIPILEPNEITRRKQETQVEIGTGNWGFKYNLSRWLQP